MIFGNTSKSLFNNTISETLLAASEAFSNVIDVFASFKAKTSLTPSPTYVTVLYSLSADINFCFSSGVTRPNMLYSLTNLS